MQEPLKIEQNLQYVYIVFETERGKDGDTR